MSFGTPQNIPNTPSQTSHAEGIWMFDGFLIEGYHSLDVCVKYIFGWYLSYTLKLCIQNYLFGPQRYSNTMMMTQQRKERKLAGVFKYLMFTPIWGRCPIWRAYFSDGLVQPRFPNSFTLNDHQINYINSSASGFTQILTWNLEWPPEKGESYWKPSFSGSMLRFQGSTWLNKNKHLLALPEWEKFPQQIAKIIPLLGQAVRIGNIYTRTLLGKGVIKQPFLGFKHHPLEGAGTFMFGFLATSPKVSGT